MRIIAPTKAPKLGLIDIEGKPVTIGASKRRTLLCFFRDAACPFCNFRIYELTQHHSSLSALGLDIVAVHLHAGGIPAVRGTQPAAVPGGRRSHLLRAQNLWDQTFALAKTKKASSRVSRH